MLASDSQRYVRQGLVVEAHQLAGVREAMVLEALEVPGESPAQGCPVM